MDKYAPYIISSYSITFALLGLLGLVIWLQYSNAKKLARRKIKYSDR